MIDSPYLKMINSVLHKSIWLRQSNNYMWSGPLWHWERSGGWTPKGLGQCQISSVQCQFLSNNLIWRQRQRLIYTLPVYSFKIFCLLVKIRSSNTHNVKVVLCDPLSICSWKKNKCVISGPSKCKHRRYQMLRMCQSHICTKCNVSPFFFWGEKEFNFYFINFINIWYCWSLIKWVNATFSCSIYYKWLSQVNKYISHPEC